MTEEEHEIDDASKEIEGLQSTPGDPLPYRGIPIITMPRLDSSIVDQVQPEKAARGKSLSALLAFLPLKNKLFQFSVVTCVVAIGLFCCIAVAFFWGRHVGHRAAYREVKTPVRKIVPPPEFPESALPEFDAALRLSWVGDKSGSLKAFERLLKTYPDAPSLHYATAFAAMQAGYPREANNMADDSIRRGFRVSDSLSLKAASIAVQSEASSSERETLLKRAIAADPMNPYPLLELASLCRSQKQEERAVELLQAAASRLNPVDAKTVIETTLAIMAVDRIAELPTASPPLGIPSKDFPNAYAEMKRGNFESAASILRHCRGFVERRLFDYLMRDPAVRQFSSQREMSEFY